MVATPVGNQTTNSEQVTSVFTVVKFASGRTQPGATNWQKGDDFIFVDVDTSAAGFAQTPVYVTSMAGSNDHYGTTGSSCVYRATATSFRVYIRWEKDYKTEALTPETANSNKWHINWIAFEPSSEQGSGNGTQTSSTTTQKTPLPTPGKYYYLVAKHTQKVLNVQNGSKENNAQLIQYDKSDSDNSKWLWEEAGDGYFYLVAKHSGKVANVAGGGSADGTNVVQFDKGSNDNSKWKLEDAGDGYFYIIGKESGKVLQVNGGNKENSAKVDQWTKQNVDHHKWKFVAV